MGNMSQSQITCFKNVSELTEAAAQLMGDGIRSRVEEAGACFLVLSGGGTPGPVYKRLAEQDLAHQIDWTKVFIRFGDDRCVPPGNSLSNYKMARDTLLDRVPIPPGNIARIQGELDPQRAADIYATEIGDREQDMVILGMGEDGHVASLFPHTPGLDGDSLPSVIVTQSPVPPVRRVSVTLGVINAARSVIFLIAGKKKAGILARVFKERQQDYSDLPAAMVRPGNGPLIWLIDRAAAGELGFELEMGRAMNF
jgi:6-phosphogluconolactonase